MTYKIHTLSFGFSLPADHISAFRGAIIKAMGDDAHPLMHNHEENGLRFAYPLVQYKLVDGRPTILAIGDVGEYLCRHFAEVEQLTLTIRGKEYVCGCPEMACTDYEPYFEEAPKYYAITRYLPLTDENFAEYYSLMALTDKICLLEKICVGNILSFLKGLDYHADDQIAVAITQIDRQYTIFYKGVNFTAFDMHFVTNALLPDGIGLGKSSSMGMGIVAQKTLPEQFKHYGNEES